MSTISACPKCGGSVPSDTLICSKCNISIQPITIYDTATLPTGSRSVTLDFGTKPKDSVDSVLFKTDEPELVEKVIESRSHPLNNIFNRLGLDIGRCWIAVNIPTDRLISKNIQEKLREKLGGDSTRKIAGDIDLIVGDIKDGDLSFERLIAFQVKKRGMEATEKLRHFASGEGTGQAAYTAMMGFDKTMLLHFFVREPKPVSEGFAASWNPIINADFKRMMRASYGTIKLRLRRELYGYAWLGWGQALGREPDECGGIASDIVIEPPFRPKSEDSEVYLSREELTKSLIHLLSSELKKQGGLISNPFLLKWPRK